MGDKSKNDHMSSASSICPSCSSNNVFLSKYRGLEVVVSTFLPRNVYRCLDCNNRFWASEPIFSNPSRVWALVLSSFAVLVSIILFFQFDDSQTTLSRKAEFIPQFDSSSNGTSSLVEDQTLNGKKRSANGQPSDALSNENLSSGLGGAGSQSEAGEGQSEQISDSIQSSIEQLELAFVKDQEELISLLKIDINHVIESWRNAWQKGATESYLSYYSNDFKPSNFLPLKEWKVQRAGIINSDSKIEVDLTDFDVSFSDENKRAVTLFTQSYYSAKYAEVSRKRLELVNEKGEWKIVSERDISY